MLHLDGLPRKHIFTLNPYPETRLTRCPICNQKTRLRKFPLFIHVEPLNPVVLGKTCCYCPDCDLLIAHQDELETQLVALFSARDPSLIGNDYLVLGTVEYQAWRESLKQPKGIPEMMKHLYVFKEVRKLKYRFTGWYLDDEPDAPAEQADQASVEKKQKTRRRRRRRRRK